MSKKIIINCDGCQEEITPNAHQVEQYLMLSQETFNPTSNMWWANYIPSLLDRDVYFCGFECLENWLKTTNNRPGVFISDPSGDTSSMVPLEDGSNAVGYDDDANTDVDNEDLPHTPGSDF